MHLSKFRNSIAVILLLLLFPFMNCNAQVGEIVKFLMIGKSNAAQEVTGMLVKTVEGLYKLYKAGQELNGTIQYDEPLSNEEIESINYINIDQRDLLFDIITGGTGLDSFVKELFRLERNALAQPYIDTEIEMGFVKSNDRLYSKAIIDGKEYTISVNVRRVQLNDQNGINKKLFIIIDNVYVQPNEIEYSAGRMLIDLYLRFGKKRLPIQKESWDFFNRAVYKRVLVLENDRIQPYLEGSPTLLAELKLETWPDLVFHNIEQKAFFVFSDQVIPSAPVTPKIQAISNKTNVTIQIINSSTSIDHYDLYRAQSNISIFSGNPYATIKGSSFIDYNVEAGKKYFYRVVAVSSGSNMRSNPSNEISGAPTTNYILDAGIVDNDIIINSTFTITGNIRTVDNIPIKNTSVNISYPDLNWVLPQVLTDESGNFNLSLRAPSRPSVYNIKVSTNDNLNNIQKFIIVSVHERAGKNRDLGLPDFTVTGSYQQRDQPIQSTLSVNNVGLVNENNSIVRYKLLDETGKVFLTDNKSFNIDAGKALAISESNYISYNIPFGNYELEATAETKDNKDELMSNNRTIKSVYIDTSFATPVYKTSQFTLSAKGTQITVDGVAVKLVDYSKTTITFLIGSENTGPLTCNTNESSYWLNINKNFLIIPKSMSATDTSIKVTFRAGATFSSASISPVKQFIKQGHSALYTITDPSNSIIETSSIRFPFGMNKDNFQNWPILAKKINNLSYNISLQVDIPSNTSLGLYDTYISWSDQTFQYYKEIFIKCVPVHDISFNGGISIKNMEDNVIGSDNMPGDLFNVSSTIKNNGGYKENILVELKIKKDTNLIYTDYRDVSFETNQTKSISFDWSTVGLEIGNYNVTITAFLNEDETPSNNQVTSNVTLINPYPLTVSILNFPKIYDLSDSIAIKVNVKNKSDIQITDAIVSASVLTPDNINKKLNLTYNPFTKYYETYVFAGWGGNYNIKVNADRRRYLSGSAESKAQCYVDLSFSLSSDSILIAQGNVLNLKVSNVGGLSGLAADIIYNTQLLRVEKISTADAFTDNGTVQVSSNFSNNTDRSIIGISRLANKTWGALIDNPKTIASVVLLAIGEGNTSINLSNVGLISSDGSLMAVRLSSSKTIKIDHQSVVFSCSSTTDTSLIDRKDTSNINVTNAYNIKSVSGQLSFDPSKLEILDVVEDTVLNENFKYGTVFVKTIDNINGLVNFGISRTGNNDKGISIDNDKVIKIIHKSKNNGTTNLALKNTALITPINSINLPHLKSGKSLTILGTPISDSTGISFNPNPQVVKVDSLFNISLEIQNIKDLFSFATDIIYNPASLKLINITEGNFLNDNTIVNTTFNYIVDSLNGSIILGISRLGNQLNGVSTISKRSLITLKFQKLKTDTSYINLFNTGLLKSDGFSRIPFTSEICKVYSPTFSLIGKLNYFMNQNLTIANSKIYLINKLKVVDSTTADSIGRYFFKNLQSGSYSLNFKCSESWGGVNSTDALLIRKYLAGELVLDSLQIKAADVNGSGTINSTDALLIRRRVTGIDSTFKIGDWVFENPTITINNSDIIQNVRCLCSGDINASYNIPLAKQLSAVVLKNESKLEISSQNEADIPLKINKDIEIGAITLFINYPDNIIEVREISSRAKGATYNIQPGLIKLAWADIEPLSLKADESIVTLKIRIKDKAKIKDIKFGVEPTTEIANISGEIINGVILSLPNLTDKIPSEYKLTNNYPNPFNPSTTISYSLPIDSKVTVKVYNLLGQTVKELVDETKTAGIYEIKFEAGNLSSGIYFYTIAARSLDGSRNFSSVKKAILMK